jgi:4-amino-4-deoxy-L-arabinose transferase-like glycosyltransferase
MPNRGLRSALPAAFICLAINLAIFAGIAVQRPDYLHDYRENGNPDAVHYVLLGRNFWLDGHYSRCAQPPYVPDILRTPVYPLFAGGLDILGGPAAIYLGQVTLHVFSCVLLYLLVRPPFGERAAFWASMFLATDLMLAVTNFEAMSEGLFLFLLLAAAVCTLPVLANLGKAEKGTMGRLLGGGTLLGLAILTRPAALYLPLVFLAWFLSLGLSRGCLGPACRTALAFLVPSVLLVGAWVARNQAVFGVARLTTVDAQNTVYFFGAGAYQVRHDVSLEEAQQMIAHDYRIVPYEVVQNHWVSGRSVAAMDAELRAVRWQVLTRYPGELALAALGGITKATFSHNVRQLACLLNTEWVAPRMGALLRCRPVAFERLARNSPALVLAFLWQIVHVTASLGLALVGIVCAWRDRRTRAVSGVLMASLAYFYLTVALFGLEAYSRCRIPLLPFLDCFAALGLCRLFRESADRSRA